MKKLFMWACVVMIMIPSFTYSPIYINAESATSNIQTLKVPVKSASVKANPNVAYWELDSGRFRVKNDLTGEKEVAQSGGLPVVTDVAQRLDTEDYPAAYYYIESMGDSSPEFPHAAVADKKVDNIVIGRNTTQAYTEPPEHKKIIAYSKTGGTDPERTCAPYNATGKLECHYPYTFVLTYAADIEVTK